MPDGLRVLRGGEGPARLVLLHGLGATAEVWAPLLPELARSWPCRWAAVDLPGHGGSAPLPRYSFGALAAAVAPVLAEDEDAGGPLLVLGHSLGGVVALALASGWFGVRVDGVVGLGIKVAWTADELDRARGLAARPPAVFDSREEAVARHLRVAGLTGLVDPAGELGPAVREQDGRWRLSLDAAAFGVGAPDLPGLLSAARAPVLLARGETDPMVSTAQLAALVPDPAVLRGCGHNAQVEQPGAVVALLDRLAPPRH